MDAKMTRRELTKGLSVATMSLGVSGVSSPAHGESVRE